jgi:hypothetical protein
MKLNVSVGFDLFEELIRTQTLAEVLGFAIGRQQRVEADSPEDAAPFTVREATADTYPVPYSMWERGTDEIPISVEMFV